MTTSTNTYGGWANYSTWAVADWLNKNDDWQSQAKLHLDDAPTNPLVQDGIWTVREAARSTFADTLREVIEDASPLKDTCCLYSDLVQWALSSVNWQELSESWLSKVSKSA